MGKVLIIEDDLLWQSKLQIIAEKAGLDIAPLVSKIEDAELYLKTEIPDLIIADIHLGQENVFTLLCKKKIKNIPVILTTVSESQSDYLKSKKLDNCIFLVKPFHHNSLLSTINILMNKTTEVADSTTDEKWLRIHSTEMRRFYKLLGYDNVISLLNLQPTESLILKKRLYELKTFSEIAKELHVSHQRIQSLYAKILEKVKSKTVSSIAKYQEYLEVTKNSKNRISLIEEVTEFRKNNIENYKTNIDIKSSIDTLEELNTKWKNVLWNKNIKTIENLLQYSKRELLIFNKLGKLAVLEIEKALAVRGFKLKS